MTIDANGNLEIYQGDSEQIVVNGIPEDQNYKVYFAVQNEAREPIGNEIMVESMGKGSVVIKLSGNYTRLFTVEEDKKTQKYYYGVKICSETDNTEETMLIGGSKMGELNTITVYPQKVEGI